MTVGFFHVARGETPHVRLAAALIRSVRRAMPRVAIVHLTDETTAPMPCVDQVIRRAPAPVALGCLEAYAACVGEWLFVDTDVIVQRDVRWIFDRPFDIAVAERDGTFKPKEVDSKFMRSMPFNKGAVFSRSPAFWSAAADHLRGSSEKRQHWMGDQASMNAVIASGRFKVEILPARYNYPPLSKDEDLNGQAILHYKGARKDWMLQAHR